MQLGERIFFVGWEKKKKVRFCGVPLPYVCMLCHHTQGVFSATKQEKKRSDLPFDKGDLLGSAYAPLVGGALTDRVTWRWIFLSFYVFFLCFFLVSTGNYICIVVMYMNLCIEHYLLFRRNFCRWTLLDLSKLLLIQSAVCLLAILGR